MLTWTERFVRENNEHVPFHWLLYDVQYLLVRRWNRFCRFFLYNCYFFYWFVKSNKIPKKWFHVWFIIYLSKIICLRICGIELQGICATTKADKKKTHWDFRLIRELLSCHGASFCSFNCWAEIQFYLEVDVSLRK